MQWVDLVWVRVGLDWIGVGLVDFSFLLSLRCGLLPTFSVFYEPLASVFPLHCSFLFFIHDVMRYPLFVFLPRMVLGFSNVV